MGSDATTGQPGLSVTLRQSAPIPLDLSFDCAPGEVVALFGASGSGKSTTLRAIAGLSHPQHGLIRCDGEIWLDTARRIDRAPHRRAVGLVFQEYALFPHRNALGNVTAALGHRPRVARAERARELLALVHLHGLDHRYPAELSGGQRQRLAIARALARDPTVLLLDEPFAAVDRALRTALHAELEALRAALRMPVVIVTHDFDDVARLADRLVVIEQGRMIASGPVAELAARADLSALGAYHEPGSVLDVRVEAHDATRRLTQLSFSGGELLAPQIDVEAGARMRVRVAAREITLALSPPDDISVHNVLPATVAEVTSAGDPALVLVSLDVGGARLLAQVTHDAVARLRLAPGLALYALIKSVAVLRPGG